MRHIKIRVPTIVFTAKIIVFSLILLGGYYLLFLGPSLALPRAYLQAQELFSKHRAALVQNRVVLVDLARLDISSSNFYDKKTSLFSTLQKTNEEELRAIDNESDISRMTGAPNTLIAFLNNDMRDALPPLLEKARDVLTRQQALIQLFLETDAIVSDLLRYDAAQDLGALDPANDKDKLIARATDAAGGIGNIMKKTEGKPAYESLWKNMLRAQNTLYALIANTGGGSTTRERALQKEVVAQFLDLKNEAYDIEKDILRSKEAVTLLTEQTNLILEYDFWLKKISAKQADLPRR